MSSSALGWEEPLLRGLTLTTLSSQPSSLLSQPSSLSLLNSANFSSGDIKVTPCTKNKFYWRYDLTGPPYFKAIETAAVNESADHVAILDKVAKLCPIIDSWEAKYTAFGNKTTIHAVHFAASIGSCRVIEWLQRRCAPSDAIINKQAVLMVNGKGSHHYTPLHCALFMSKTEAAIWLLDAGASATIPNADGLTPSHLLAWVGAPYESAERRLKALERVATKLVEKSANLAARSSDLSHRTDEAAKRFRSKTPLELAVGVNSSYPKQALHLLTESYHCPKQGVLFKEVHFVAMANPTGAEVLVEKMRGELSEIQRDLRREVRKQVENGSHMETFLQTLRMSVVAGVKLLELLLLEPAVTNPQRYPLPLYTVLPNGQMLCTYQPAEERPLWECKDGDKDSPPAWHSEFKKDLPSNPLLHTDVYEVKIRVLHLPGVINIQTLSILSMLKPDWHQMSVFGQMSVKAIILCIWDRIFGSFAFSVGWEAILLLVILAMGISPPPEEFPVARRFMYSVLVAHLVCESGALLWGLAMFRKLTRLPLSAYMHYAKSHICFGLALMLIINIDIPLTTGLNKTLVVINVFVRCIGLMFTCRAVPIVGPLIIAVVHSFLPMRGMFIFMGMVFTTFAFAFIIFRDDGRDIGFVLAYVYQGMVLADRDATLTIAGIDLAHEQTFDFKREMFTGGGDEWILHSSAAVALLSSSVFSLVLLNLTVGMYTNIYETMEPLAKLMFQQRRAKQCVSIMLQPPWHLALSIHALPGRNRSIVLLVAFMSLLLYVLSISQKTPALLSGLLLALIVQLMQALLLVNVADVAEREDYLWVNYRFDYADEFRYEGDMQEIKHLRRDALDMRNLTQLELTEIRQELINLTKLATEKKLLPLPGQKSK